MELKVNDLLPELEPEDLLQFGLIPEFVGRLPVVTTLEELDQDALVRILQEPKNALLKQYRKLFEMEDVRLTFTAEAIQAIAAKSIKRKTGARGLRSILESTLLDVMFDIPAQPDVREVVINKEAIENQAEPLLIYEESPLEAQA